MYKTKIHFKNGNTLSLCQNAKGYENIKNWYNSKFKRKLKMYIKDNEGSEVIETTINKKDVCYIEFISKIIEDEDEYDFDKMFEEIQEKIRRQG